MPEHLRALIVILVLAMLVFAFAKPLACAVASSPADFQRRRILWFALALAAFLAHNFWIFIIFAAGLLLFALPQERNRLALYFFVLFAVPPVSAEIPGLGLINHFFAIDYLRLLALCVLLPSFLHLRGQPDVERFGRSLPDKLMAAWIILVFALRLRDTTLTDALRTGALYAFTDTFLPYYVASRSLRNLQQYRDALMAFVTAALVLSALGAFEFAKRWLLYAPLPAALGVASSENWAYLMRGQDLLRAQASTGHAIYLGYMVAVATGFFLYLRELIPHAVLRRLALALLLAGVIAPMSRGPWVGLVVMVLVFVATSAHAAKRLATLGLAGAAVLAGLMASPVGQTIIDYLPFVGTVEAENISYRQRIVEVSMEVIWLNPFFGDANFLNLPVMQQLRQGQGIIDIVNTYLGIALESGFVGLSLFLGFFIVVVLRLLKRTRALPDRNGELYLLGQALLATVLGILVIIATTSNMAAIPAVYWSVAGLCVAYVQTLVPAGAPQVVGRAGFPPAAMKTGS